jgi:hypothetical protein
MSSSIEQLIHKQEIQELQVIYAVAIDSGDYDRLDNIFTDNAVGVYGRPYVGLEAIKGAMYSGCEYLTSVQHLNANHWSVVTGDTAEAGCYLHVVQYLENTPGGDHHEMGGEYSDELVLTESGWRITKRSIEIKWTKGNPLIRDKRSLEAARGVNGQED